MNKPHKQMPASAVHKWKTRLAKLAVYAWLVVIGLILLEAGVRIWLWHLADGEAFLHYASGHYLKKRDDPNYPILRQSPARYLGYYPKPNYSYHGNNHNALGFRGSEIVLPKPEGEFRIACLGGSTTYCSNIDSSDMTYPAALERALQHRGYKATVINAGNEAWTSYESLINYALRVSYLDVDMILVYHGINDLLARIVWPPQAYKSDNSGFRATAGSKHDLPTFLDFCLSLRVPLIAANILGTDMTLFRTYDIVAPTWHALDWWQMHYGGKPGIFADVSLQQILQDNPPVYFERNLEHLVALASADGVHTLFVTFVHQHDYPEQPLVSAEAIQGGYQEMNQVVRQVAKKTGASLCDAAAVFPHDTEYFVEGEGIHFSQTGADIHAGIIAHCICQSELIPDHFRTLPVSSDSTPQPCSTPSR